MDEDTDLSDDERAALHELQLGVEHLHRGYGHLVDFHHETGHAMDHFDDAREKLRAAGHDEFADRLRDDLLPAGVVGDRWTYELVEEVRDGFLADATGFESDVRSALVDGVEHVDERELQREWRERAEDS